MKLVSAMKRNDARAFGRYYLYAGSIHWDTKHFTRYSTTERSRLIWKWRHRAAVRGNAQMRDAEDVDLKYVRQAAAHGEKQAKTTLRLYDDLQRQDKRTHKTSPL